MINPAADNYDRILPSLQNTNNAKIITTGNMPDFIRQMRRPPNNVAQISSASDNYNRITYRNQMTANQPFVAAPARGPQGVNAGVFSVKPQYTAAGSVYYPN